VSERLELQDDVPALARLTQEREPGCLAPAAGQRLVAEAAASSTGCDILRPGTDEVGQDLSVAGADDRAVGHREDQVRPLGPVALVALAGPAVGRTAMRAVVVLEQRRDRRIDPEDDVAPATPVAPVRASERPELLPVDGRRAVAAVARGQVQDDAVDKGGHG